MSMNQSKNGFGTVVAFKAFHFIYFEKWCCWICASVTQRASVQIMLKEEMEEKGQPIVGPDSALRISLTHILDNDFHFNEKLQQRIKSPGTQRQSL